MKIFHISSATDWRGGEAQAFHLIRGLRRKGHELMLIAPERSPLLVKATAEGSAPIPLAIRSDLGFSAFWKVRNAIRERNHACEVEVDGGIYEDTAPKVVEAGANVLVAGSAVYDATDGVAAAIKRLLASAGPEPE